MNTELVKSNDKAVAQVQTALNENLKSVFDFRNTTSLEITQRYIRMLADANSVPKKFRNKQTNAVNYGDLLLIFDVMQNTGNNLAMCLNGLNPINGLLSAGAEWKKTQLDKSGRFYDDDWVEVGKPNTDSWGYYYQGIRKKDNHKCKGPTITVKMAKDMGWWTRDHSLWPHDTENMLRKRALSRFVNDYAPDVSLNSVMDEDTPKGEIIDVTPQPESRFDKPLLSEESQTPPPPPPAPKKEEKDLTQDTTLFKEISAEDMGVDIMISEWLKNNCMNPHTLDDFKEACTHAGVKYGAYLLDNDAQGAKTVLQYLGK